MALVSEMSLLSSDGLSRHGVRSLRRSLSVAVPAAITVSCVAGVDDAAPRLQEAMKVLNLAASPDLFDVRDIEVGPDGRIWVLDGGDPFVQGLDPSGRFTTSFGTAGEGPGELRNPQRLFIEMDADQAPRLWIWDVGVARFLAYDMDGTPAGAFDTGAARGGALRGDIRAISYAEPFMADRWQDGFVVSRYPNGAMATGDLATVEILQLSEPGEPVVLDAFDSRTSTLDVTGRELAPVPLWVVCHGPSGSALATYSNRENELVWRGSDDVAPVRLDPGLPAPPVTDADIARYLRHVISLELGGSPPNEEEANAMVTQVMEAERDAFVERGPRATRLLCDRDYRLWFELFSTDVDPRGRGRTWVVYDTSNSTRIGAVRFPDAFQLEAVVGDRAFGIARDQFDVERVAVVVLDI